MRITKIELQNFRAFYGPYIIDLTDPRHQPDPNGKNLLVYGENGSGKSSLYIALREFLFGQGRTLEPHRNIFVDDSAVALIRLSLWTAPRMPVEVLTWSDKGNGEGNRRTSFNETDSEHIRNAARTSGFLEYKGLLETYFLQIKDDRVNIFDLLVNTLLKNMADARTGRTLQDDWNEICDWLPRRHAKNVRAEFQKSLRSFNERIFRMLKDLERTTEQILRRFGYRVDLGFRFEGLVMEYAPIKQLTGASIHLDVRYFNRPIKRHHTFLNEAKLSALALAIYFAALKQIPHDKDKLNLLVLDDVLIGLDMSNRLPMLDILEQEFKEYQIVFLTYDRVWYEMVKERLSAAKWKSIELFCSAGRDDTHDIDFELPLYTDNQSYLERAKHYLEAHDYKAAAMYARTALESCLKKFCDIQGINVRYRSDHRHLANELWSPAHSAKNETAPKNQDGSRPKFIAPELVKRIDIYNKFLLNPLSHDTVMTIARAEVEGAIAAVAELEETLRPFSRR